MAKCMREQCPHWMQQKEVYMTHDNRQVNRDLSRCGYGCRKEMDNQKRPCQRDDKHTCE
ncbi:MAG: hypothetical protein ACRCTE_06445 [Cellulosilyticaceae bacterium]